MRVAQLDKNGRYIIKNYHRLKPFASFLPGIAGPIGIPLWVFYVIRGQGIASFGVENKENPIMEFLPANKSYQTVSNLGFRTFLKVNIGSAVQHYEPFGIFSQTRSRKSKMYIGFNEFEIEDQNDDLGLATSVLYFTLPSDNFAALVRKVTVKNTSSSRIEGDILDGLPVIIPFGVTDKLLKSMSSTAMAWMGVENLDKGVPYYKIGSLIADKTEVEEPRGGHFYLCFASSTKGVKRLDSRLAFYR